MAKTMTNENSLSKEMTALLEEFSTCFQWDKAGKLLQKINERGKKDGLSKEQIRGLIFSYFKGELGDRHLRRLLPLELKYTEFANKKKNPASEADIMSASYERADMRTIPDKPEVKINEDHHITSGATTEVQEHTMENNKPRTDQIESTYAAVLAASTSTEQKAHIIDVSSREEQLIASLKAENKKLRKDLAEKNNLLSRNIFEGEFEQRGLLLPLVVQIDWHAGRAIITRK